MKENSIMNLEVLLLAAAMTLMLPIGCLAQAPAFCPVAELTKCHHVVFGNCTDPTFWHGIDSLEGVKVTPINDTHVSIRSLYSPPKFEDTIGNVIVLSKDGSPADPRYCVKAPPAPTPEGNCTTHIEAFFSDAGAVLQTVIMQSCDIITWKPVAGTHAYDEWYHANTPKPSPPGAMCDWTSKPAASLYAEVGDFSPNKSYFMLENVQADNQTQVRIRSLNASFPDTVASVTEVGDGTPGKISWHATLFDGKEFRGVMRANSAGGVACCETKKGVLSNCPVLSWWAADGQTSCWAPVNVPSESYGACGE
jgi:hypothetical protein